MYQEYRLQLTQNIMSQEQEQNFLNQEQFRDTTKWYSEENQEDVELRGLEADMDNEDDYE